MMLALLGSWYVLSFFVSTVAMAHVTNKSSEALTALDKSSAIISLLAGPRAFQQIIRPEFPDQGRRSSPFVGLVPNTIGPKNHSSINASSMPGRKGEGRILGPSRTYSPDVKCGRGQQLRGPQQDSAYHDVVLLTSGLAEIESHVHIRTERKIFVLPMSAAPDNQ